jgi:DeoR/GlpR family transcriptional regulator of sugar metabolism
VGRRLAGRELTVITNGLSCALALSQHPATAVIVTGGLLNHASMSLVGPDADASAARRLPDVAFLSAPAVGPRGVMDTNPFEVAVKRALIAGTRRTYVLADHTKLDRSAFEMVVEWSEVDALVTDRALDAEWTERMATAGVRVLTPGGPQSTGRRATWQ